MKSVKFCFPSFTGSGKGKRSGKGGTVFRTVSEKFCAQVYLVPFGTLSAAAQHTLSESKKEIRLQRAAAGVFVISSVLKRGCIVGPALDLFLETSLLNDWCVVLLPAAMLFAIKAAHMGLGGGLYDAHLPFWLLDARWCCNFCEFLDSWAEFLNNGFILKRASPM